MRSTSRMPFILHPWPAAMLVSILIASAYAGTEDRQTMFGSPGQALTALQDAASAADTNAVRRLLGPVADEFENPDPVQRVNDLHDLARHFIEYAGLSTQDNGSAVLILGKERWPFPIPLVTTNGQWVFDTPSGKEEILNRRIGHNELSAMEVCHAYVLAQREYIQKDHDGNGIMEYARRLQSSSGKKDGLYWAIKPGEPESPFGPLVAHACEEGYSAKDVSATHRRHEPFHGYMFRILSKQGRHAPGDRYDYVINGHMVAGFALVAYPAQWGNSGVMTFIVNQQGKIYQSNLGAKTGDLARKLEAYDPDKRWTPAE